MRFRDRPHDRQAEAGAPAGAGAIAPCEALKGAWPEVAREAGAVAADVDLQASSAFASGEGDVALPVPESVVDQVPQRLTGAERIEFGVKLVGHVDPDRATLLTGAVAKR